ERKAVVRSPQVFNAEIGCNDPLFYIALSYKPRKALFRVRRKSVLKLLPQAVKEGWRSHDSVIYVRTTELSQDLRGLANDLRSSLVGVIFSIITTDTDREPNPHERPPLHPPDTPLQAHPALPPRQGPSALP